VQGWIGKWDLPITPAEVSARPADELSAYGAGNKWRSERVCFLTAVISARFCMPITPYLNDLNVDPETKRVLGVALEKTRVSLGIADDFADGVIARRIVELAKAGERNPDLLCDGAIEKLRGHLYGD
jgi:hypothetical protein